MVKSTRDSCLTLGRLLVEFKNYNNNYFYFYINSNQLDKLLFK
jgi:hypothetical protein